MLKEGISRLFVGFKLTNYCFVWKGGLLSNTFIHNLNILCLQYFNSVSLKMLFLGVSNIPFEKHCNCHVTEGQPCDVISRSRDCMSHRPALQVLAIGRAPGKCIVHILLYKSNS